MQNTTTIYRFNTPFLDIEKEKSSLISVKEKIKDFINHFEWIDLIEEKEDLNEYIKFKFTDNDGIIKLRFYYIKEFSWNYYMPIFKMDIFVDREKIDDRILVGFLVNIFECFDWLNEKEFLIDLNNSIYYKEWLFTKIYPEHSFSDLEIIKTQFEENKWNELLERFITEFSNKNYKLTIINSDEYHRIHSTILYYIYLVYIMYQNIYDSKKQLVYLETQDFWENNGHKELIEQRLKYVNDLSITNFKKYYDKLEVFFRLFK